MARRDLRKKIVATCASIYMKLVQDGIGLITIMMNMILVLLMNEENTICRPRMYRIQETFAERRRNRVVSLWTMTMANDQICIDHVRMDKQAFNTLLVMVCDLGGLKGTSQCKPNEMLALFLYTLGHHHKNRLSQRDFRRSGDSISRYFNRVLLVVLRLRRYLLKKAVPVSADETNDNWKWFQNCLGAIDGTYISCRVAMDDKTRYKNRKGDIAMNVLGACAPNMQFTYVLPGWEGSAHDNRVLRDALSRENGLKVPRGCYYLCDAGYTNGDGFLAPYRGQRYHLNDWRAGYQPETAHEHFNMRHSKARNVIERCFGILKCRWSILRKASWYPIKTQVRIVTACCLLHNFCRQNMSNDPFEAVYDEEERENRVEQPESEFEEMINNIGPSSEWTHFREELAESMWQKHQGH